MLIPPAKNRRILLTLFHFSIAENLSFSFSNETDNYVEYFQLIRTSALSQSIKNELVYTNDVPKVNHIFGMQGRYLETTTTDGEGRQNDKEEYDDAQQETIDKENYRTADYYFNEKVGVNDADNKSEKNDKIEGY